VYSDVLALTGTAQQYTFRGNSLFDPDLTATGHQPMYYDQYIAVYEKYRVFSASMTLDIVTSQNPLQVVVIPSSTVPTITSASQALESPRACVSRPVSSVMPQRLQTPNFTTQTILGLRGGQIWDTDFSGLFSANPVDLWYLALYIFPLSGNVSCSIRIKIIYNCEFYDRQPVAIS
jgi:hypothetical protein